MSDEIAALTWPADRLGEAMEALAQHCGLAPRTVQVPAPPETALASSSAMDAWIDQAAAFLGIESEAVDAPHAETIDLLRRAPPALVRLPGDGAPRFLALAQRTGRDVEALGPEFMGRVRAETLRDALCEGLQAPLMRDIDGLLDVAGVTGRRRDRARQAILRERLSPVCLGGVWLLRLQPGASFVRQALEAGLHRRVLAFTGAHAMGYALLLLAWWMVGRSALQDRLDRGLLIAWALLLVTVVPFQVIASRAGSVLAIDAGTLLKRRLLAGALALEPEEVRSQGAGGFLGRVIESEAVEGLVLSGGMTGLVASMELLFAGTVLTAGSLGALHALLLCAWIAVGVPLAWRYLRRRSRWTTTRLTMTQDLVERMMGHRTRLAQEPRERWHEREDQALSRYLERGIELDRSQNALASLMPRGWLVVGVLGMTPAFIAGTDTTASLAVSLGGVLLAYRALRSLASSLAAIAGAAIAWKQVAPLFQAASRVKVPTSPSLHEAPSTDEAHTVIEASNLVFRHRVYGEPTLKSISLRIASGERLLLQGPSGGGKSTLGSILAGLRVPESGLLLLEGLDRKTLGSDGWRRRVVAAPQFHENHVLSGTFAFNLLMGRAWPPRQRDLLEAELVCREMDLGGLLERMPAGLLQMVGETGWQLSHGERSRLFIARALLQEAELIILDESFAALDPETLSKAMRCVLARAPTLLVIAHP